MEIAMLVDKYLTQLESPSVEEFSMLRSKIGWDEIDVNQASVSLANSLFHVTIRDKSKLLVWVVL